eukprot:4443043-Amphidinium_carterae.1
MAVKLPITNTTLCSSEVCHELTIAGYVGGTIWFLASALLSFTERWNTDDEQRERFGSVLSAMPFTLVHLTGDYPLIDYSAPSKVVPIRYCTHSQPLDALASLLSPIRRERHA